MKYHLFKTNLFRFLFSTTALILIFVKFVRAQTDTIVLNNQKIACVVKEVTPEAVKYSFLGEDLINSVYKNGVQKIIFKSGRIQTFAEATSYKIITNVMDYDKVTITSVENEIKGLYKLGDVNAKAKGTTVYSNQEKVKERAYHKLKIQAAMVGANIIFLTNQRTEGNKYGTYFTSGSTAETNLTGVAYSNLLPDYDKFKTTIGNKTDCIAVKRYKLWASDSDVSDDVINKTFKITNILNENGVVIVEADLQGEKDFKRFQLVNFNENEFSIAYKDKGTAYNFTIKI